MQLVNKNDRLINIKVRWQEDIILTLLCCVIYKVNGYFHKINL